MNNLLHKFLLTLANINISNLCQGQFSLFILYLCSQFVNKFRVTLSNHTNAIACLVEIDIFEMYLRLRDCLAVIASLLMHAVYSDVIKLFIKPSFSSIMIDFDKIYCKLHPCEPVKNFCSQKSCLVGLCPTCICDHTLMHMQSRTQPQYENIRDTYTRMHEKLRAQIDTITEDKDRLNSLFVVIKEKKENFKETLMIARKDCLQVVNDHFDELEKRWQNEINSEGKKNSLHSNYRLETVSALINKELSGLIDQIRRINSKSFVEEIPRVEKEVLVESQQFHSRIISELEDNENYTPIINYSPDNLREVTFSLRKLLSLQFSIPLKKYLASAQEQARLSLSTTNWKPIQVEQQKRQSFNQSMVVRRASSAEKVNAAFTYNQQSYYPVPIVLTTSYLSNPSVKTPQALANQSRIIQKSRLSGFNFGEVDMSKFSKGDKIDPSKSMLKHKKSGLTLFTAQSESQSTPSEKENTRR